MPYDLRNLNLSTWSVVRFFLVLLALGLIYVIRDVLAALFFAIIVASALEPAIGWLKNRKIPRLLGVILIYMALGVILFFFIYMVFPLFFDEFKNISTTYPALQKQILSSIEQIAPLPVASDIKISVQGLLAIPADYLSKLGGGIADFASAVFGGLLSFVLLVVFSFYLAAQEKGIETFLRMVTPLAYEPYIIHLWIRSQKKLGRWLQAQILLGAIIGVLVFFGLTFLGVEHALLFAFLAAAFEIIPVVGPILAAVPAVIVAFLDSSVLGFFTLILYVVAQQVESHVIVPVVMRKTVGLSPLIVVFALVVGGKVGGIFGILLAVPIMAIMAELLEDWDKKKRSLIPGS